MPLARLADHARGRRGFVVTIETRCDEACALAGRGLLLDGPDDDDTKAELSRTGRAETGPGGHERCERPLRVDAAAAEEHIAVASSLDPDWDIAWHGVDVAKQDDDASGVGCADFADGIARFIHERAIVASRPHLPNQPVAGLSLVPRP